MRNFGEDFNFESIAEYHQFLEEFRIKESLLQGVFHERNYFFVLLGIRVIIGINIAQAGKTLNIIIPKNKEEFPIIVEKPSIVVPEIKMENISHFWGPYLL